IESQSSGVAVRHGSDARAADGAAALFDRACAHCHGDDDPRAPSVEALQSRSPQAIIDALTAGAMRYQGLGLSGEERRALAELITGRRLRGGVAGATIGACGKRLPLSDLLSAPLWNGWGASVENSHFQGAERAGVGAAQVPHLHLKWAFGFPDTASAWAQ